MAFRVVADIGPEDTPPLDREGRFGVHGVGPHPRGKHEQNAMVPGAVIQPGVDLQPLRPPVQRQVHRDGGFAAIGMTGGNITQSGAEPLTHTMCTDFNQTLALIDG